MFSIVRSPVISERPTLGRHDHLSSLRMYAFVYRISPGRQPSKRQRKASMPASGRENGRAGSSAAPPRSVSVVYGVVLNTPSVIIYIWRRCTDVCPLPTLWRVRCGARCPKRAAVGVRTVGPCAMCRHIFGGRLSKYWRRNNSFGGFDNGRNRVGHTALVLCHHRREWASAFWMHV